MRLVYLHILLSLLLGWPVLAQDCPPYRDKEALLRFLIEHHSHSTIADPACVDRAFASLSDDKSFTEFLVKLLDFEHSIKNDGNLMGRTSQYPAIGALARLKAVPELIGVIKESDSELVRTNAAHALDLIHTTCVQIAVEILETEAANPNTTINQRERLQAAEKYINEHVGPRPCYSRPPIERK
jgi:hypothetical protein